MLTDDEILKAVPLRNWFSTGDAAYFKFELEEFFTVVRALLSRQDPAPNEVKKLRAVYEAARSVLRFNGVDEARTIAAVDELDDAIEQVKQMDGGIDEEPAATQQEKPLLGNWRHGNGVICCGTLRIAREDFDTQPNDEFKKELLDWVCATLNSKEPAASAWMPPAKQESIDFGDYVYIEQKRYGVPNEMFLYKVIGRIGSNAWIDVPASPHLGITIHDETEDVVNVICCGVLEDTVERYRVKDVRIAPRPAASAVPADVEGWKLVPIEPMHEQKNAGVNVDLDLAFEGVTAVLSFEEVTKIYKAMLEATPTAPRESVAPAAQEGEIKRLREIARLIGAIFVYGDFKAETFNERSLVALLRGQGCFYESVSDYEATLSAAPTLPASKQEEPLFCGVSRTEFHDKAWSLYHAKTFEDTMLPKVNIHTIRTVFDAIFDSLAPSKREDDLKRDKQD